jgi:sugar phosphate isomerase/epimerase
MSEEPEPVVDRIADALAANLEMYPSYSLEVALDGAAQAGFRAVELAAVPGWAEHVLVDGSSDARLWAELKNTSLTPVALLAYGFNFHLPSREGRSHAIRAVQWAAANGVPLVNLFAGGDRSGRAETVDTARSVAAVADREGVGITIEVGGAIIGSGAEAASFLDAVAADNLTINYDTGNSEYYAGMRALDELPQLLSKVGFVHLKDHVGDRGDWCFPPLGDGDLDLRAVLELLQSTNYRGGLSTHFEFDRAKDGSLNVWPADEITDALRLARQRVLTIIDTG